MRPPVLTDTGRCYPANMQKLPTGYSGNFNSRHADKTFPCLWETEKALVTPHMIWGDQIAAGSGRGQALLSPFKADAPRDVRNIFEAAVARQANRVAAMEAPGKEDLMALTAADLDLEEDGTENSEKPGE